MKKLFRSKIFWAIVILLVAIHLIVPPLITPTINKFLADFSPVFKGEIKAVTIHLFRGAYGVRGLEISLKDQPEERFIQADRIDVSIAWRNLIKGNVVADVDIFSNDVIITDDVLAAIKKFKSQAKKDTKKAVEKTVPFRIERIDIHDSSIEIADMRKLPKEARWRLDKIEGRISNATASEKAPVTLATFRGSFMDAAPIKVIAHLNTIKEPLAWDADMEIKDFELPKANGVLKNKLPLTFTRGNLDLYSEVKSEGGTIRGYAKPFFHKVDVVTTGEDFKGLKHYGIEASTAAVNLLLRNAKDKTLATKILFSYNEAGLKINSAKALSEAIANSFGDEAPEGIEDSISLSDASQIPVDKKEKQGDKP